MRSIAFIVVIVTLGCGNREGVTFIVNNNSSYDTLYVNEVITGRSIARIPLTDSEVSYNCQANETILAQLSAGESPIVYLTVLSPGITKSVVIDSLSIITKHSIVDSLQNYLLTSTNSMFADHGRTIFQGGSKVVIRLFDSLMQARQQSIEASRNDLYTHEYDLLTLQNKARAHSFLMYYGRVINQLPAKDSFFDFVKDIDNTNKFQRFLPQNVLYKYEVEFLMSFDSIPDVNAFLAFIDNRTPDADFANYLKAIYLRDAIGHASYWQRHRNLFTSDGVRSAYEQERNNPYAYFFQQSISSFYSSQSGVEGFDFEAKKADGNVMSLSDLRGKVVLIDAWATWCGPCISQRPAFLELAKKFQDNPSVAILMISVDDSESRWKSYVMKTNPDHLGLELFIKDGMNSEFGDRYLVKAIPKYILIDHEGVIVDANLSEPSMKIENLIYEETRRLTSADNQ
ncbi:MAG: TlpA family protein disulfide reductase [Cyclobacteriaceae bacterium]